MSKNRSKIVACLDMGTTKIVCIIAAINKDKISVLGYGYRESRGIISSAISDMKLAQKSIANVVADAEKMAGFNIDRLIIGLSGNQTISHKTDVSTKIASDMVRNSDILNLAKAARTQYKKDNREIIHLIPLQYRIDNSTPIHNPRYMAGEKLSTKFHVISTSITTVKNIENCLKTCQLSVNNYISESYASALSSLTENELNLGTLVIDIGGSSTSFSIIIDNKLVHTGNINIGGMHVTRDIAAVMNVDFETAEKIKNLNSSLTISPIEEQDFLKLNHSNSEDTNLIKYTKSDLRDIIGSRLEEIMESVKASLDKDGYNSYLISNVVLTGGTASVISIEKIALNVFDKQVRIGYPQKIKNLPEELKHPAFCSATGMLVFLKNIYLKEKIKDGFESKSNWLKKCLDYLLSV